MDLAKTLRISREFDFLRPLKFDYRTSIGLGKWTLEWHKQNLVHTRTQEKRAVTSKDTDPDLPVSVKDSPAEVCALLWDQGH